MSLEHAMTIMGEELRTTSRIPVEKRTADRLMTDLGINESEAQAYADIAYERYLEAYSK